MILKKPLISTLLLEQLAYYYVDPLIKEIYPQCLKGANIIVSEGLLPYIKLNTQSILLM